MLGFFGFLILAGIGLFAYMYITTEIPQPEKFALAEKTTVYYNDGTTPIGSYADQNREIISCADLPDYVGNAIVASEDRSFYTNKGIDPVGIARAFYNNLTTGSRQGGSTITQQYAERYYLGETTSYVGKLKEAFLAVKISQAQDKSQVLCNYMNTIYLGRNAYGIQAAAKAYYGKDAKDLTLSEAAMLAGIIPGPSVWNPDVNPKQAEKRYKRVIRIMDEDGYITPGQKKEAKFPQVIEMQKNNQMAGPNGYLLTMVKNELISTKAFTEQDLDTGGYKIVTTIDKGKQDLMFATVSPSQNGMQGIIPDGMQFGAMSANPKDGSIIALYAGDDYLTKQLNNVTQATYEVGSTMKPFALLATTDADVSFDTSFNGNSYRTFPGITQTVSNYGGENLGYVNLYTATAQSSNTVFMDLQTKLGAQKIADTARKAGVEDSSLDGSNPFTVLGNNALTVKDMTQGYATLANQGNKPTLHMVATVQKTDGTELYNAPTSSEQMFEANSANLVTKALTGVVQRGTATEARAVGHTIAGKSGTANDSMAASFIGYTPSMVTTMAMWYPSANGSPQEIPAFGRWTGGSDYPVHLFTEYMKQALANTPNEDFPAATDNGKIGGPDGTWGTGARSYSSKRYSNQQWYRSTNNQNNGTTGTPSTGSENTQPSQPTNPEPNVPSGGDGGNSTGGNNTGGNNTGGNNTGSNNTGGNNSNGNSTGDSDTTGGSGQSQ